MWGQSIVIFLIGACFMLMPPAWQFKDNQKNIEILAANFNIYQKAAVRYYQENPSATGVIPNASLDLMPGYNAIGSWQNQIDAGVLYIYAPDGNRLVPTVIEQLKKSKRVGVNKGGDLISPIYGDLGVTLPNFIGDGSLVTISN